MIVGIAIAIITTNIFPLSSWATANNGTTVKTGDIIADRERARTIAIITTNIFPLSSWAAVEKTKSAIASIESELELKQSEIDYLSGVKNLDPIILEHEQAKLKQLKLNHTATVREYQLAMGKMQTAKSDRSYKEYQASINTARRVEEQNQARLNYQRQLSYGRAKSDR